MRAPEGAALVFLVALHAAAALGKLLDVSGFAAVVADYRLLPPGALPAVAFGLPVLELAVAGALVHPAARRSAAWAAAVLALAFGVIQATTLWRGIALENCGCFGVFLARPLRPWTPLEDVLVAAIAGFLARRSGKKPLR